MVLGALRGADEPLFAGAALSFVARAASGKAYISHTYIYIYIYVYM